MVRARRKRRRARTSSVGVSSDVLHVLLFPKILSRVGGATVSMALLDCIPGVIRFRIIVLSGFLVVCGWQLANKDR